MRRSNTINLLHNRFFQHVGEMKKEKEKTKNDFSSSAPQWSSPCI